ncbi:MAG: LamG-like jellyroll fold domain-containing protein, partial [Planctomycetota bacterium]
MAPRRMDFFRLEDRVMLSADAPDLVSMEPDPDLVQQFLGTRAELESTDNESPAAESVDSETRPQHDVTIPTPIEQLDLARPIEVVFVDAGVADAQSLIDGLRDSSSDKTQWVLFEISADRNGIEQIGDALKTLQSVDAVHLLSHGDDRGIQLGNARLDLDSAPIYAGEIATWGHALDVDADLLIYGCDLASSQDGQDLIELLALVCNCDVAASDDLTGHEELGGDWILEYTVGDVQTDVAFGYVAQSSWYDTLATITVTTTDDEKDGNTSSITALQASSGGSGISLREAIIAANNTAGADTIILGAGTYALDITGPAGEDASATGDLDINTEITIVGDSTTTTIINASALGDRILDVRTGSSLTLSNMMLTGANTGSGGAGALVTSTASLTATDVVFSNNTSTNVAGHIQTSGTVDLTRVALVGGTAIQGGAMRVEGGTTTLTNVTVSGNTATTNGQGGGGIFVSSGSLNLVHSTIADNTANSGPGGGISLTGGGLNMSYSIIADNAAASGGNDLNGNFITGGYNIIEDNSGFTGASGTDIVGSDPGLSSLTLTGGTYVHTIASSSVAYDAAVGSSEAVDQTGTSRDANPDIGAYEYRPLDTDGDGINDSVDLDDDNDGILDTVEDASSYELSSLTLEGTSDGSLTFPTQASDLYFSPDGTNLFISDTGTDSIYHYSLANPFDVTSGMTHVSTESHTGEIEGLAFSADGSAYFMAWDADGLTSDQIRIWYPNTPFTLQPATWGGTLDVNSYESNVTSLTFSADGMKMFITGTSGDDVTQLSLGAPYDLSSVTADGTFGISTSGSGIAFSGDGYFMFIANQGDSTVTKYKLDSAFDITGTVTNQGSFSVSAQTDLRGVTFNDDGSRMYVVGRDPDVVHQYDVTGSGADSDNDGLINSLDLDSDNDGIADNIEAQSSEFYSAPSGNDGNSNGVDDAYESAELITNGDFTTDLSSWTTTGTVAVSSNRAVFNSGESTSYGDIRQTIATEIGKTYYLSYDIDVVGGGADTVGLRASAFNGATEIHGQDHLKTSSSGETSHVLVFQATSTSTTIVFEDISQGTSSIDVTLDNVSLAHIGIETPVDTDGDGIADYRDTDSDNDGTSDQAESGIAATSDATYADPNGITNDPQTQLAHSDGDDIPDYRDASVTIDTDGDGAEDANDLDDDNDGILDVDERVMTGFDLSSPSVDGYYDLANISQAEDLYLSPDGTTMFVTDFSNDTIKKFTLATPFDVTGTVTQVASESFGYDISGITFSVDGMKMFLASNDSDAVRTFTLANPFELNSLTWTYTGLFNTNGIENAPQGITFSNDGLKMFIVGTNGGDVTQFSLTTAYDLSSGVSEDGTYDLDEDVANVRAIAFSDDGTRMFVAGNTNDRVYHYSLNSAFDVTGTVSLVESFLVFDEQANPRGLAISQDGTKLYITGRGADRVHQYSIGSNADIDTDNDGTVDRLDLDSDNDGIADNIEAQTTAGYVALSGNDSDNDGLDDAYEGSGDEGITPVDTDSDSTPDFLDTDSDNDGTLDSAESGLSATSDATYANPSGSVTDPANDLDDSDSDGTLDYRDDTADPANDWPTAVDDSYNTSSSGITVNVLSNDTESDGGTLQVIDYTDVSNGTLIDNGSGSFTYTPSGGFSGTESFEYMIDDNQTGLSHFYGLNGNGTDSIGGNDASTIAGTTTGAGNFGDALFFDEVDDYVRVPDLAYANEFTVSFDFKVDDNSGSTFQYFYSHGSVTGNNSLNVLLVETGATDPNTLRTAFGDSNDTLSDTVLDVAAASYINSGQWHNYTLTVDAINGAQVYIDGALAASDSNVGGDSFNPTTDLYLGGREDLDSQRFLGGGLDSVRIYNRALDSTEVNSLADQASYTAIAAFNVSADEGTYATASTDGGLSLNIDGGNDIYLQADTSPFTGNDQITIEVEFSIDSPATDLTTLFSYTDPINQDELFVGIDTDGEVYFRTSENGGTGYGSITNASQLFDGDKHTVSVTWENSTGILIFYVDGEQLGLGRNSYQTSTTIDAGGTVVIGQHATTPGASFDADDTFSGTIYSARVFNDVRTAEEIQASYRSDLPFDEVGLIANWRFDQLSTGGVVTESVSGNNLTVRHTAQSGFTASEATLTFAVDENAVDGTAVGSVSGIDTEREAQIASLLAADSDLVYSSVTNKFYKANTNNADWTTAQSNAGTTLLNGVGGQLATIRSAAENEIVFGIVSAAGEDLWLGGNDATVEGEFRWQDGSGDTDRFWNGNGSGYAPGDAYANFLAGQPNDNAGNEDHVLMRTGDGGAWIDNPASVSEGYLIEWDADAVLDATQALIYSIQSQTVTGAFTIDSSTGRISVADGTLLDSDTQATHTITVRTTDVDNNTRDQTFTVSLNNLVEDNNAPSDLSGGIELNTDGGNDALLIANDGGAILGGLTQFTLETSFLISDYSNTQPLFSYAAGATAGNDILLGPGGSVLGLSINNTTLGLTGMDYSQLADGQQHTISVSWDNTNGDYAVYVDGEFVESGTGLEAGYVLRGSAGTGEIVFGNEQDTIGGGFETHVVFNGVLYDVRIWNAVRSEAEISLNHQQKFDTGSLPSGLVANWQMDGFNGSNEVVDVVSGNNLSVGHATGAGFTNSTPVGDLSISEVATAGSSVGFIVPSDPDAPRDIVDGGSFLNTTEGNNQTGSVGDWTVLSGNVDVTTYESGPLGGVAIDLNGDTTGAIGQTLTTEAGKQYQIVFALSGNWGGYTGAHSLRVSAGGESDDFTITQPSDWSSSNMLWSHGSMTFTAESSTTDLAFASLQSGVAGPMITDVRVIEVPQAINTILNNDPTLSYDAATNKFYRLENNAETWPNAQAAAVASQLNGVSGQLLTLRSAYEFELAFDKRFEAGLSGIWVGASDQDVEGDWYWYDGTQADELFWQGAAAGSSQNGNYNDWHPNQPNDSGGQHYGWLTAEGIADALVSDTLAYVVEWDASEVLSSFKFEITDQDANGPLFSVDSSTGEVSLANPTASDGFTNHLVWYDASDASTITESAGSVSAVTDKTTGNDLTQGTASAQPTLATAAINGLDALSFDGDDLMSISSSGDLTSEISERSVTIVFEASSDVTTRQVLYEQGRELDGMNVYIEGGKLYAGAYSTENNSNWPGDWITSDITGQATYVVTLSFDGDQRDMRMYVNGELAGSVVTPEDFIGNQAGSVYIGGYFNHANFHDGSVTDDGGNYTGLIGEFSYNDVSLDGHEVVSLHAHLMNKWMDTPTQLDYETATSHSVSVNVTDAAGNSYSESMTIAVDNALDATQTVPGAQTVNEDATLTFSSGIGNAVTVSDTVASANTPMQVSLSVNDGNLTLSQTAGITFVSGSNGSNSFVINGTESDLNAAFEGMTFRPRQDFSGSVTLSMTTALKADLEGHYTFEGGNANDQSVGTADSGTLNGTATTVTDAERGEVLLLDGSGDVSISTDFGQPTTVTLAAWVNFDAGGSNGVIFNVGGDLAVRADASGQGLIATYNNGSTWPSLASDQFIAGTGWRHVAVAIDSLTNTQTLYLDGEVVAQANEANGITDSFSGNHVYLGSNNGATNFFEGKIDEARIYTRALAADEIQALVAEVPDVSGSVAITVTAVNDAPAIAQIREDAVAAYDFEDGLASIVSGGPTLTVTSPVAISNFDGYITGNDGLLFPVGDVDSSTPAVEAGTIPGVASSNEFSFAAQVRFDIGTGTRSWERIIDFGGGLGQDNIILAREGATNNLYFQVFDGSTPDTLVIVDALDGIEGEWKHFSATLDSSGYGVVYMDGVAIGSKQFAGVPDYSNWTNNYIGSSNWTADKRFQGVMDDIGIFDRALTSSEIASLANTSTSQTFTIAENSTNGTRVGFVHGGDAEGDSLTYSLTQDAQGRFAINSSTGEITVADSDSLDFEGESTDSITVRVSDGTDTFDEVVNIQITNATEAPTGIYLEGSTVLLEDNFDDGNATGWNLPSGFSVSGGELVSGTNNANQIIRWTDVGALSWTDYSISADLDFQDNDSQGFAVRVQDDSNYIRVNLNATTGDVTANTVIAGVATQIAVATDAIPAQDNGRSIGHQHLTVRVVGNSYTVQVDGVEVLTFSDSSFASGTVGLFYSAQAHNSSFDNVRVVTAPVAIDETTTDGTVVGYARGIDDDTGDTVTYSLVDDAGGRFAINSSTGQITIADETKIDFEAVPSHQITVRATDSTMATTDEMFDIAVNDINEAPAIWSTSSQSITVLNHSFEDNVYPDGGSGGPIDHWTVASGGNFNPNTARYPNEAPDGENIAFSNGGTISQVLSTNFDSSLDYELTVDVGTRLDQPNDDYAIRLYAGSTLIGEYASAGPNPGTFTEVTLQVEGSSYSANDGEALTIELYSGGIQANFDDVRLTSHAYTASVSEDAADATVVATVSTLDLDAGSSPTFALTGSAGGRFAIDANTGVITVANSGLIDFEDSSSHNVTVQVTDGTHIVSEALT